MVTFTKFLYKIRLTVSAVINCTTWSTIQYFTWVPISFVLLGLAFSFKQSGPIIASATIVSICAINAIHNRTRNMFKLALSFSDLISAVTNTTIVVRTAVRTTWNCARYVLFFFLVLVLRNTFSISQIVPRLAGTTKICRGTICAVCNRTWDVFLFFLMMNCYYFTIS